MAENLREVIARRLANSQTSKTPTPAPAPKEVPQEVKGLDEEEFDDEGELDEEEVETPIKEKKVAPKVTEEISDEEKQQALMQENAQRIMMLQDNGIFRAELLHQLNEIKRALTILASIGIELTKPDEK